MGGVFDCQLTFNPACACAPSATPATPPTTDDDLIFNNNDLASSTPSANTCFTVPPVTLTSDQILGPEESQTFLSNLMGYGQITKDHLDTLHLEPAERDRIWQLLITAGYINAQGVIQRSFLAPQANIIARLQELTASSGLPTNTTSSLTLISLYRTLRQNVVPPLPISRVPDFATTVNRLLYPNSPASSTLSRYTVRILQQDQLLRGFVRLRLLGQRSLADGLEPPALLGARQQEQGVDSALFHNLMANGLLPPRIREALEAGEIRLKIRYSRNSDGQINNIRVLLQSGFYEETIAEIRNGRVINDGTGSPLSRGVITFLQNLLAPISGRYLSLGHFDLASFYALQQFANMHQSSFQLNQSFDVLAAQLRQLRTDARRAWAAYQAAPNVNIADLRTRLINHRRHQGPPPSAQELENAQLRFQLAREALTNAARVLDFASQYQNINLNDQSLTQNELSFILVCRQITGAEPLANNQVINFRDRIDTLLNDIMDANSGLLFVDLLSFSHLVKKYNEARNRPQTAANQGKLAGATRRLTSEALRIFSALRQWQRNVIHNRALFDSIGARIVAFRRSITEIGGIELGPNASHVSEQMRAVDEQVTERIAASRTLDVQSTIQLRERYIRARDFSEALRDGPARDALLQLIRGYLQSSRVPELISVLRTFAGLGTAFSSFAGMGRSSYQNNILESFGIAHGDGNNDAYADAYDNTTFGDLEDRMQNKILSLASQLYSVILEVNTGRPSSEHVTFNALAATLQRAMNTLRRSQGGNFIPDAEIRAILNIVAQTTDSAQIANIEMSQRLQGEWTAFTHRDYHPMRGAQELVITPRLIEQLILESQRRAAGLTISRDAVTHWAPASYVATLQRTEAYAVCTTLSQPIVAVSTNGPTNTIPISVAPAQVSDNIVDTMAGTRHSRRLVDFLSHEPIAVLNTAIMRYHQTSDAHVPMLDEHGSIPDRMTGQNLRGVVQVFGEGTEYTFRNGVSLTAAQITGLQAAANTFMNPAVDATTAQENRTLAGALGRLAAATPETTFSESEFNALTIWLTSSTLPEMPTQENLRVLFPTLDDHQRSGIASAVEQLRTDLPHLERKRGINSNEQRVILDLATQLSAEEELAALDRRLASQEQTPAIRQQRATIARLRRDIAIKDSGLASETPAPELIAALTEANELLGRSFNHVTFSSNYTESIRILRRIHRSLVLLASKYKPPAPPWRGYRALWGQYWHHVLSSMQETVASPSQRHTLTSGVPDEMNILLNMALDPDSAGRLGNLNRRITDLRRTLGVSLEQLNNQLLAGEQHPLVRAVQSCQGIPNHEVAAGRTINALLESARRSLRRETLQPGDLTLAEDEQRVRTHYSNFEQLMVQLSNLNQEPVGYVSQATELLESVSLYIRQIDPAIAAERADQSVPDSETGEVHPERNAARLAALNNVRAALQHIHDVLTRLVTVRESQLPQFAQLNTLENQREHILNTLSSDRFDAARFRRLQEVFGQQGELGHWFIRSRNVVLDWVGNSLAGTSRIVTGINGHTGQTIQEILLNFFDTNHDGRVDEHDQSRSLNLSSLLPQPGEDETTINAKIALSRFFQELPQHMQINIATTLVSFVANPTGGLLHFGRDLPAFLDGILNIRTDVSVGPENYRDLRTMAQNPWRRVGYRIASYLAMSGNEHQEENQTTQVYMLLGQSRSQRIRDQLAATIGSRHWTRARSLPFQTINRATMRVFMQYAIDEVIARLENNPALRDRLQLLHNTNALPLSPDELLAFRTPDKQERFLRSLSDGEFRILDTQHDHSEAARFVSTILQVVSELNQSLAVPDIRTTPMTFFDPVRIIQDLNVTNPEIRNHRPEEVYVIHYNAHSEAGPVRNAGDDTPIIPDALVGFLELLASDAGDFLTRNLDRLEEELSRSWNGGHLGRDVTSFFARGATTAASSIVNFCVLMGRQIGSGLSATVRGFAAVARHAIEAQRGVPGAEQRMREALQQSAMGLAETTGAFTLFEAFVFVFYTSVLNRIDDGDYAGAVHEGAVILLATQSSIRAMGQLMAAMVRAGSATIDTATGMLRVRNAAEFRTLARAAMTEAITGYRQNVMQRTGFRLMQLFPVEFPARFVGLITSPRRTLVRGGYFVADAFGSRIPNFRYLSGGMEVSVQSAPVQMTLAEDGGTNTSIYRFDRRPTELYRALRTAFRKLGHGAFIPRQILDATASSRTAGAAVVEQETAATIERIMGPIRENPRSSVELMDGEGNRITATRAELGRLIATDQRATLRLAETDITLEMVARYEGERTAITEIFSNNNVFIRTRTAPNGQASGITVNIETYQQILAARARGPEGLAKFREIINQHNLNAGAAYTDHSINQLFEALRTPANIYHANQTSLKNQPRPPIINEAEFLRLASSGEGLGRSYNFEVTIQEGGRSRVVTEQLSTRQIVEILHGQTVISTEFDAQVRAHFSARVPHYDLQRYTTSAYNRFVDPHIFLRPFTGSPRSAAQLSRIASPGYLRRAWRALGLGASDLPGANFHRWQDVFHALGNENYHPLIERYQAHLQKQHDADGLRTRFEAVPNARVDLAQRIFADYEAARGRALDVVIREFLHSGPNGAAPVGFESARAALDSRGSINGRQFRSLLRNDTVRGQLVAHLNTAEANFHRTTLVGTSQPLPLVEYINRLLPPLQNPHRSVVLSGTEATEGYRLRTPIRPSRITVSTDPPPTTRPEPTSTRPAATTQIAGTPVVTPPEHADAATTPQPPVTTRVQHSPELQALRRLLLQAGVPRGVARSVTTTDAALELLGRRAGDRLSDLARTQPERYRQLLTRAIQPTLRQNLATGGINIGVGVVSALAIGELLHLLGIRGDTSRSRAAHLILSIGAGHATTVATSRLATRLVQGRTVELLARGLNATSWATSLGHITSGLGRGMLFSALYRQILDNAGVAQNFWMRSSTAEIIATMASSLAASRAAGLAISTAQHLYPALTARFGAPWAARLVGNPALAGTSAAAGAALGRLNIVLTGVQLASFATTLAFSNRAVTQNEAVLDQWRTALAGSENFGDNALLFSLLFVDLFTHDAQASMVGWLAPELRAEADHREVQESLPRVLATLRGSGLIALQAMPTNRSSAAFLRGDDIVGPLGPLAEQLAQPIVFENQVETRYNVVAGVPSDGGGVFSVPVQRVGAREADAYEWLTNGAGSHIQDQAQLISSLRDNFGIREPEVFLDRVNLRNLQDQIGQLVQAEPGTPPNSDHLALRATFNENGTLRGNPHDRNALNTLAGLLFGGDNSENLSRLIATIRQAQRLRQIMATSNDGRSFAYQQADVSAGLVTVDANGLAHINETTPAYLALQQAMATAAQQLAAAASSSHPPRA
ncbi:hypothetical protein HZB07_00160 [Candidatus Saganbacteria bacterium]|nr:hypothetical protein [Candidatus Saganbacteria bacterium]